MRLVLFACAALLASSASGAPTKSARPVPAPADLGPPLAASALPKGTVCHGKIETVRAERGLPRLDRGTASDKPMFIAAVDRMIDGCEVLVMRNDTSDIRPLPDLTGRSVRLQRLR